MTARSTWAVATNSTLGGSGSLTSAPVPMPALLGGWGAAGWSPSSPLGRVPGGGMGGVMAAGTSRLELEVGWDRERFGVRWPGNAVGGPTAPPAMSQAAGQATGQAIDSGWPPVPEAEERRAPRVGLWRGNDRP